MWNTHIAQTNSNRGYEVVEWCKTISGKVDNPHVALENYDLLKEHDIDDWGMKQINTLYRQRNQHGVSTTIQKMNELLTSEKITLTKTKEITNIHISVCGYV